MKRILLAAVALTLLAAPAAYAQPARDNHGQAERQTDHRMAKPMPPKHWSRGEKLPPNYRGHSVDYRRHHLKAPPRGYHWVQANNQYMMIGVTSGVIAAIIGGR